MLRLCQKCMRFLHRQHLTRISCRSLFTERDEYGGQRRVYAESLTWRDKWEIMKEFNLRNEIKNAYHYITYEGPIDRRTIKHGDFYFIGNFRRDGKHKDWVVSCDSHRDVGYSTAEFVPSPSGTALFRGSLSTRVPRTGDIYRAGFVNVRSPYRMVLGKIRTFDLVPLNCVVIRYRGDGRIYRINLHRIEIGNFDVTWFDLYYYSLFTRGGPYWQVAKIPISKFIFSFKQRIQDNPHLCDLTNFRNFSVTLADNMSGPFQLEIDYIALYYDAHLHEKFAYETYYTPGMMKLNL